MTRPLPTARPRPARRAPSRLLAVTGTVAVTFAVSGCALWGLEGGPDAEGAATPPAAATAAPAVAATEGLTACSASRSPWTTSCGSPRRWFRRGRAGSS
ncbi:hypothetical protein ACFQZ4_51270 [Catellatospora coxensis]